MWHGVVWRGRVSGGGGVGAEAKRREQMKETSWEFPTLLCDACYPQVQVPVLARQLYLMQKVGKVARKGVARKALSEGPCEQTKRGHRLVEEDRCAWRWQGTESYRTCLEYQGGWNRVWLWERGGGSAGST